MEGNECRIVIREDTKEACLNANADTAGNIVYMRLEPGISLCLLKREYATVTAEGGTLPA